MKLQVTVCGSETSLTISNWSFFKKGQSGACSAWSALNLENSIPAVWWSLFTSYAYSSIPRMPGVNFVWCGFVFSDEINIGKRTVNCSIPLLPLVY
jgi:hypothetical protein